MPRVAEGTSTLLHEAFGFALPKGLYTDMSKEVEGRLCDLLSCLPLAVGASSRNLASVCFTYLLTVLVLANCYYSKSVDSA